MDLNNSDNYSYLNSFSNLKRTSSYAPESASSRDVNYFNVSPVTENKDVIKEHNPSINKSGCFLNSSSSYSLNIYSCF